MMLSDLFAIAMMALTIYREARNEPTEGQLGVAWVIINRMNDLLNRWPKDAVGVITQKNQFSSITYQGDRQLTIYPNSIRVIPCIKVALQAFFGLTADPTSGANHYHAIYMDPYPSWADPAKMTRQIGLHKFYKL